MYPDDLLMQCLSFNFICNKFKEIPLKCDTERVKQTFHLNLASFIKKSKPQFLCPVHPVSVYGNHICAGISF